MFFVLSSDDCVGYVESVSEMKVSHLKSLYFDIQFKIDNEEYTKIRVMDDHKKTQRDFFQGVLNEGRPLKLSGLNSVGSGVFYNAQRGSTLTKITSPLEFECTKICCGKVIATKVKDVLTCVNTKCQHIIDVTNIVGKSVTCVKCGFTTLKKFMFKYVVEIILRDENGRQHFLTCLPSVLQTVDLDIDNIQKLLKFKNYDFWALKTNNFVFRIEKHSA